MTSPKTERDILRAAKRLFKQKPDWETFYREILGTEGLARKAFSDVDRLIAFEQSEEYFQIQKMLARLRSPAMVPTSTEPTRVITVRMPKSLHDALRTEAYGRHTSMNKLCISKLLQIINEELVPEGFSRILLDPDPIGSNAATSSSNGQKNRPS